MSESQKPLNAPLITTANNAKHITASDWFKRDCSQDCTAVLLTLAQRRYLTTEGPDEGPYNVSDIGITDRITALKAIITHKISRNWPLVDWCSLFRRKTECSEENIPTGVELHKHFRPSPEQYEYVAVTAREEGKVGNKNLQSMSCSVFLLSDSKVNAANYLNRRLLLSQLGGTPMQSVWLVHCSQLSFDL